MAQRFELYVNHVTEKQKMRRTSSFLTYFRESDDEEHHISRNRQKHANRGQATQKSKTPAPTPRSRNKDCHVPILKKQPSLSKDVPIPETQGNENEEGRVREEGGITHAHYLHSRRPLVRASQGPSGASFFPHGGGGKKANTSRGNFSSNGNKQLPVCPFMAMQHALKAERTNGKEQDTQMSLIRDNLRAQEGRSNSALDSMNTSKLSGGPPDFAYPSHPPQLPDEERGGMEASGGVGTSREGDERRSEDVFVFRNGINNRLFSENPYGYTRTNEYFYHAARPPTQDFREDDGNGEFGLRRSATLARCVRLQTAEDSIGALMYDQLVRALPDPSRIISRGRSAIERAMNDTLAALIAFCDEEGAMKVCEGGADWRDEKGGLLCGCA
uniref:Uncharacterized protein n=1 Tax=Chromera velia CCMP2878 TaxID=1169474 RepID=A0A0G4HG98_9ALVE|eukprot:Cvel_6691.t1-p1 / transcript=Cvel_6691.t1 / gene=Cvel_6691 / organism=Chromera_velia_CCMP2878 / gene_product=hypothetical protein / transcript_product=hypothetical protein / location=Cvel_scaffold333:47894-51900(+) / protein_length=385 / sequence_SO=supercontig / SO=protein_coding / is_pseudo=false